MGVVESRSSKNTVSEQSSNKQNWEAVRILDIILNMNHPKFEEYGGYDSIGTIYYTILKDNTPYETIWATKTKIAKPLFSHLKYYPLINEIVLILNTNDKNIYNSSNKSTYYLPQVNIWNHPHHNALPSVRGLESEDSTNDYPQTENGITRRVEDGSTDIPLGEYFKEQINIKPLLPYEGDMIIEGRFGNSIRFGSTNIGESIPEENKSQWSQTGNIGDPITIIRNGQPEDTDEKGWVPIIEDSNNDASIIYMTSNQQINGFTPASLNQQSFGADIESQIPWDQELSDPFPPTVIEPEEEETPIEEEIPMEEETPINSPELETTQTGSSNIEEEEEEDDELTPFDEFMGDEELDWYEISILDQYEPSPDFDDGPTETPNNGDLPIPDSDHPHTLPTTYPCVVKNSKYGSEYDVHLHVPLNAFALATLIGEQPKADRVKFLCIHTSAGHQTDTHRDIAWIFMKKWRKHGYNITIEPDGGCVQIYKDTDRYSNGVGEPGYIPDGAQSQAINSLVLAYIKKYPDIKVVGHNQFRAKECPWFYVPEYLKELQKTEPTIKNKNIYDKNYNTAMPAIAQADYLTGARDVANIIQQPEGRNV